MQSSTSENQKQRGSQSTTLLIPLHILHTYTYTYFVKMLKTKECNLDSTRVWLQVEAKSYYCSLLWGT